MPTTMPDLYLDKELANLVKADPARYQWQTITMDTGSSYTMLCDMHKTKDGKPVVINPTGTGDLDKILAEGKPFVKKTDPVNGTQHNEVNTGHKTMRVVQK